MINSGEQFINIHIDKKNYICLGTPFHVKMFYKNNENNIFYKTKKRYCFDLDNTLITFPKIKNDYTTVEPIQKNIDLLNFLKNNGNTIIIYTARRMHTHGGNIGKLNKDIGKITFDTLDKFNINYDEIYFGKPHADFYIDDLAISCFDDLEKKLGFYKSNIDTRDFNSIQTSNIQTFIKKSNDLSGEINYYKTIDISLKSLFPKIFNCDPSNKWFEMEKLDGLPFTNIFLSEELTIDIFTNLLNTISKLHHFNIIDHDKTHINIYENYCNKLISRYSSYDYSKFINSDIIYNKLFDQLKIYQDNNKGIYSVIHGDLVFTNIILTDIKHIKLIDMRGKLGNKLTIYGDRNYDYAKLLQSIIGYDEILQDKYVSISYRETLLSCFKQYIIDNYDLETYENIKIITKSLLFSLIPLHNNEKCIKYYDLISTSYLN
jgi:capsule biosynthesis phosphatase